MNSNHQSSSRLTFKDESEYLKRKFRENVTSGETGLSSDELQAAIVDIDKQTGKSLRLECQMERHPSR